MLPVRKGSKKCPFSRASASWHQHMYFLSLYVLLLYFLSLFSVVIVFSNDSHFHLLSLLLSAILIFSVWNWQFAHDNNPKLDVMGQNLIDDFCESGVNVDVPLRNTNNEVVKSNKCNQCNYASSQAGNLRTHLKIHSGEKSYKCNQCDYASSRAGNLRTHLKKHSGEKPNKCSQCVLDIEENVG